jgi:hypothetical protein
MFTILDAVVKMEPSQWAANLEIFKWPIAVLVIVAVILIVFYRPIFKFINSLKKVSHGDTTVEADAINRQIQNTAQDFTELQRVVAFYRKETYDIYENYIKENVDFANLQTDADRILNLLNYATIVLISKDNEKIYSEIFGSQIGLLQKLNASDDETADSLNIFYTTSTAQYPGAFDNFPYDRYLGFLYHWSLIKDDRDYILITSRGMDFLKYLTETRKHLQKAY